jgi:hypothetical protein
MKLILCWITILLFSLVSHAQGDNVWRPASKESEAYHQYRTRPTIPPYSLSKIKELIKDLNPDEEDTEALKNEVFNSLSLREKFTYVMIHGESYSQNCDPSIPIQDEHKKIFANLPEIFNEYSWSDRQAGWLKKNRDSVIALMKESITRSKRVGVNFKHAIVEVNAVEMIPFLIDSYRIIKKDFDILTVLMQLMKENEYEAFIASGSHRKLYSEESSYDAYLNFSKGNEDLIIKRATDFYNENRK